MTKVFKAKIPLLDFLCFTRDVLLQIVSHFSSVVGLRCYPFPKEDG